VSGRGLHVGLNLIFLVPGESGGMEIAARELIPALVAAAPEVRFTAFINREAAAAADGPWGQLLAAVTVPVRASNRLEWVRGEQALLPVAARRAGVDVLHSLASTAPGWGRFARVTTIYDLIYRRFPDAHAGILDLGMRVLVPLAARRSRRLIVSSASTRRDLVELLGIDERRIDLVPLGVARVGGAGGPVSAAGAEALDEAQTRARFDLGERRVLLSLSAKRPHKNLAALLGALAMIEAERRPVLVLAGYHTDYEAELRERARSLGLEDDVRFEGWLSASEVEGLWALTEAFVFPSLYEGFGLPVLEAMARGVAVACADASSLPEVAGEAAILFDPGDERAIAAAITRLLEDPRERERLRVAGRAQAARFTWERAAQGTLASYRRALGAP
jgi:glycosyltransferase involved in cell wall biosynthesis